MFVVRLFDLCLFGFVSFLFLLVSGIVALPGLFSYLFCDRHQIIDYEQTVIINSFVEFIDGLIEYSINCASLTLEICMSPDQVLLDDLVSCSD